MQITLSDCAIFVSLSCVSAPLMASPFTLSDTEIDFSGYIKADAIFSDYSDGTLSSGSIGRDFYIPSLTPVGGNAESTQFDAHIRESRFRITTTNQTAEQDTITGVLEFDMLVTPSGDDRISNSYVPRIRHAFIRYNGWTVGQTWTTFMDVSVLPEALDFIGNTDGITFARQVMVRYTTGAWDFALENPESTITPFQGGARITADDNPLPDFITRYTYNADWGYLKVAGLARQLSYDDGEQIDDTEFSFGLSLTARVNIADNQDLRVSYVNGVGLGRYLALNAANGGVLDAQGNIEAIDSSAFAASYRYAWNDAFTSSLIYSAFDADNDVALTGVNVTSKTQSMRVNLLYQVTKEIMVGGEFTHAKREIESGLDGDMNRLQFSMKYAF